MTDLNDLKYLAGAVAFAGAAILAYREKEGWGWLVFAGILVCS
jgi:hypothetical protein